MRIYKYPLEITDRQIILIGTLDPEPLSVAEQDGQLMLWVKLVEPINDEIYNKGFIHAIEIDIVGTGNECSIGGKEFIGTVVMSNGLVWHVFYEMRWMRENHYPNYR